MKNSFTHVILQEDFVNVGTRDECTVRTEFLFFAVLCNQRDRKRNDTSNSERTFFLRAIKMPKSGYLVFLLLPQNQISYLLLFFMAFGVRQKNM